MRLIVDIFLQAPTRVIWYNQAKKAMKENDLELAKFLLKSCILLCYRTDDEENVTSTYYTDIANCYLFESEFKEAYDAMKDACKITNPATIGKVRLCLDVADRSHFGMTFGSSHT